MENNVICSNCGHLCGTIEVDNGIGPYEFWGDRGVHHDWQTVSGCCQEYLEDGGCSVVRTATHVARKAHGAIQPGDTYRLTVYRHWREVGPSWVTTKKVRVSQ